MPPATSGPLLDSRTDKRKQAQTLKPKQKSIRTAIRGLTKNLRIHTDKADEVPEDLVSYNRTPPLEPESPISPSMLVEDSSSHNSNTFSGMNRTPQSQSKLGRLIHNLKEDWEAGIDPEYYHAKRERERQAMNRSPGNTAGPSQPQSRNSSRSPERATSSRSTPTRKVSQRKAAKAAQQHKDEIRKLQREESVRKLVKQHRDFERWYFEAPEDSPKFAPLHMLQQANDARIQVQERELCYAEERERRRNYVEWERRREVEERRHAHAPPGFRLPPPEYNGKNPYELRTHTAKESQTSGPQRSLSFQNGPDHVGASRPDGHRSTQKHPFGQPRHDIGEDSGPSSMGQNTYLYYRPEPQPASDQRLPSDQQTEYLAFLNSHAEPDVAHHALLPSNKDSVDSMPERFQNYRSFYPEPEVPRHSLDSGEEDSVYSQTAEEKSAGQGRNINHRAAPERPHSDLRRPRQGVNMKISAQGW